MPSKVILFIFYCLLLFVTVSSEHILLVSSNENNWRFKRQDERWTWGYVDTTYTNKVKPVTPKPITETKSSDNLEENPCLRERPQLPDFRAPGRRLSEIKCYEYIWEIKKRQQETQNLEDCQDYRRRHPTPTDPHFAIGGVDAKPGEFPHMDGDGDNGRVEIAAVGGTITEPGEFPHMAAVGWKALQGTWIFKCGSSLISPKFVLTAAHCTRLSDTSVADPVPQILRLGDKNIIDSFSNGVFPYDRNIVRIIKHPTYKSPKKYNDIALMEMHTRVYFDFLVQPACLWSQFDTSSLGNHVTLTGWGVVETAGRTTSPELQVAEVNIIDSKKCDELLKPRCNRHWCGITDSQICAGKLEGGVDACQGDSGGPLQVQIPIPTSYEGNIHRVIGVTSFGFGCALENTPGVYTRVSSYIDWIEDNVWKNEEFK